MSLPSQPEPQFSDTIKDLKSFLQRPRLQDVPETTDPLRVFVHLLWLSLLLSFGAMMLLGLLRQGGLLPEFPHVVKDLMKEQPFLLILFLTTVAAPLAEELAFRLWLVYNPLYFALSLSLICGFLFGILRLHAPIAAYAVLAIAVMVIFLVFGFREASQAVLEKLYYQYYGLIFYGATLLFALIHLSNFEPSLQMLLFTPALVLPQFLLGLVLGYLRVRQGLVWAMVLHGLYNALILSLAYMGLQQAESPSAAGFLP